MRRRRLPILRAALWSSTFPILTSAQGKTIQLAWATDGHGPTDGTFGPDGPWQALAVAVGTTNSTFPSDLDPTSPFTNNQEFSPKSGFYTGAFVPLFPSGGGLSILLASATSSKPSSGVDFISNSSNSSQNSNSNNSALYNPNLSPSSIAFGTRMGNADEWMSWAAVDEDSWGEGIFDVITLGDKIATGVDDGRGTGYFFANGTINSLERYDVLLPDGRRYTPPLGVLGLGTPSPGLVNTLGAPEPGGILLGLKREDRIGYAGFGMHIGSVAYNQPGSLVLGGYEKSRVLGEVGVFTWDSQGPPYMFLVDVLLGAQLDGDSSGFSFGGNDSTSQGQSIWVPPTDTESDSLRKRLCAKEGTAVVVPNPAVPYVYLPKGVCEAAAERLPVKFNESLGLYIWDRGDEKYGQVMRSSAYMSFVLADSSAKNVTIKVPFQLMNLTLEAPLVEKATPYFPCQSLESNYGFWTLGRAFLQAAFLGVDLERNLTYLVQAPGPGMEQSIVRGFVLPENGAGSAGMESNDIREFESSWSGVWSAAKQAENPGDAVDAKDAQDGTRGLSGGAIAGIVVGVLAVITVVGFAIWALRKRLRQDDQAPTPVGEMADDNWKEWSSPQTLHNEMDTERDVAELGVPTAHEMDSPVGVHEAPDIKKDYVELPAEVPSNLLPGLEKGKMDTVVTEKN